MKTKHRAILYALLAAALFAISIPLSKLLLHRIPPAMMAAFLYLGAGIGLFLYGLVSGERKKVEPLTKADLPYTVGMILLGERPGVQFYVGLAIMAAAAVLMGKDTIAVQHSHMHTHVHSHPHCHGDLIHTHEHTHTHSHLHVHGEDEAAHGHSHEILEGHDHTHL